MKQKNTTIILFITVLAIWGAIGWKIYLSLNNSSASSKGFNLPLSENEKKVQTFTLLLNYEDPFLKRAENETRNPPLPTLSQLTDVVMPPPINAPENNVQLSQKTLLYKGLIQADKRKTGLVSIDGKSYIVEIGKQIEGLRIITFNKTSLLYLNEKQQKVTIYKK